MPKETRSIAEALRRAYEGPSSCPPPEAFLAEEIAALDAQTRANLEAHAEQCPACAAERELAQTFDGTDAMTADESREVQRMVRRLERTAPGPSRGLADILRFPALAGLTRSPAFRMAAAAVLVVAIGLAVRTSPVGPPALPDTVTETVMRGSELTALSPVGEVEAMAEELAWEAVDNAATYRLTLEGVDGTVLWETSGAQASAPLPETVRAQLHRAVKYVWSVEALDSEGVRIASSGPIEFRLRPGSAD